MVAAMNVPARADVDKKYTWNAESVFPNREAWQTEFEAVSAELAMAEGYKGRLSSGAATLADWTQFSEDLYRRAYKLYFYAAMSKECDSNDLQAAGMTGQAGGLFARIGAAMAFAQPEMLAISEEILLRWTEEEPRLAAYQHSIRDLFRQQQHVRSGEVEEVLGMVSDPLRAIEEVHGALTSADLKFGDAISETGEQVEITQSNINTLLDSADRDLRRTAWEKYMDGYLSVKNALAATYTASVKSDIFGARARRFETALQATLFGPNIPLEVFHNLIDTYKQNIPTWHKYWAVRRRALNVETLHSYDIWAPIATDVPRVSYEQAVDWISTGMQPLGDAYVAALRKGCLEERWVDVYPSQGKRQGAFSFGTYDTFPFIMMSYDNNLGALSTLAHELGHSLHSYYSRKQQPYVYSDYSMFVAEVASNFNQAMTRAYLFEAKKDDAQFQIALIEEAMSNFHRYFFIMPTLARFEYEIHTRMEQGKPVTVSDMNSLMTDLFSEGYGGQMHIDHDRIGITWATFGHLYANYYTFQYATGISAAHSLAEGILAGEAGAAERYLGMLSAGSSVYPIDALAAAGVDMRTPAAVEQTFAVLARYVERLDALTR